MARAMWQRGCEERQAPASAGIVALARQPAASASRAADELGRVAPDRRARHQRRRGLAQRAGAHQLAKFGDAAFVVQLDVHRHPAAADRRALLDRGVRIGSRSV